MTQRDGAQGAEGSELSRREVQAAAQAPRSTGIRTTGRPRPADRGPRASVHPGYAAADVRAAEAPLIAAGEPLMRRAASGLAAELRRELEELGRPDGPVLLLAGSGANGGDGLFAAAELAAAGVHVTVIAAGSRLHAEALAAAEAAGVRRAEPDDDPLDLALAAAVLVDALVGTGTSGEPGLRGAALELVMELLPVAFGTERPRIVAVDLPSGIGPDDGAVADDAVLPADVTVTFGAVKAGLLLPPAAELVGELRLIDIGLGPALEGVTPLVPATAPR